MPITFSLISNLFFFGFTLWLSAYLLARASKKAAVWLTAFGLLFFALVIGFEVVWGQLPDSLLLIPALLWIGAVLYLVPEDQPWREGAIRSWIFIALPVLILTILNRWFSFIAILALIACSVVIARLASRSRFKNTLAVLTVIGLFVALSTGLLVLPLNWLPRAWTILLLGLDLFLLGIAITVWDAFEEGERFRSHLLRSFVASLYYAGALAALVILAITIDGAITQGKLIALVSVIAFGILTQTFSNPIQATLDRLTAPQEDTINEQRKTLRETAEELPRLSLLTPQEMDQVEFARLTRRALSHLGDLPKLATSPLIHLPAVVSTSADNPLDRALRLKMLLVESIQRLKPQGSAAFGTTEEWRYYNVLYYPYVRGLKPYTRRNEQHALDEDSRQALSWFQNEVPERTLHNWQNTAAKLVAGDLRNR